MIWKKRKEPFPWENYGFEKIYLSSRVLSQIKRKDQTARNHSGIEKNVSGSKYPPQTIVRIGKKTEFWSDLGNMDHWEGKLATIEYSFRSRYDDGILYVLRECPGWIFEESNLEGFFFSKDIVSGLELPDI